MANNMASTSHNETHDSQTISGESRDQGQEPFNRPPSPSDDEPTNLILAAIDKQRQQLLEIITSGQPMSAERRKQLNQQQKDLKEHVRQEAELRELTQEYKTLAESSRRREKEKLPSRQDPSSSDSGDTGPSKSKKRHKKKRSPPRRDPSSSDPSSPDSSDSDDSSSASSSSDRDSSRHSRGRRRGRSRRRSREQSVTIGEVCKLTPRSSLRHWADWKTDLERLFRNNPKRYTTSRKKIDKALDFTDQSLRSMWRVEEARSLGPDVSFKAFTKWVRTIINGGSDEATLVHERYEDARQQENQSPFEFDAYLTSLEILMDNKGDYDSAMSFYRKLQRPLRDQLKASKKLPKTRRRMVSKAQRLWEAILKRGRLSRDQPGRQPRQRSQSPRYKSHAHQGYRDRSRSRHRHKDDKDHARQDSKDQARCYRCGEPGHYIANCPKKQKRVHAVRQDSRSRSSSSSAASRAKTLSPSPPGSPKN